MSAEDDWENWLVYFLNGVIGQSEDALSRAERINLLLEKWKAEVSGTRPQVAYHIK